MMLDTWGAALLLEALNQRCECELPKTHRAVERRYEAALRKGYSEAYARYLSTRALETECQGGECDRWWVRMWGERE